LIESEIEKQTIKIKEERDFYAKLNGKYEQMISKLNYNYDNLKKDTDFDNNGLDFNNYYTINYIKLLNYVFPK
jgi:hypothetical protein